ncbi:polymeric immunoglobulin receptor-like [Micropterus salmoides]|uniref:polymeric immunoglobulin receptor-like n=1 Tax=Micropterus salmoides TaxID=27706 RepID=UPI0018ECCED7|nr:polymeric immunoglobulin receptor-like [Micropterus salmoides]
MVWNILFLGFTGPLALPALGGGVWLSLGHVVSGLLLFRGSWDPLAAGVLACLSLWPVLVLTDVEKALCGGNTGLVSAQFNIYTGAEGGTGTINCYFTLSGSRKFFCKNECKAEDILVKTDDVRAQSGRISIDYRNGSSGRGIVSVTITNLIKSDSGQYRCGLGGTSVPESFTDFEVRVSDVPLAGFSGFIRTNTEGEDVTLGCSDTIYGTWKFFCKGECKKQEDIIIETDGNRTQSGRYSIKYEVGSAFGLEVSITQVTKSDSGQYRCGYGRALSPDSYSRIPLIVIDAFSVPEATNQLTGYFLLLVVCLPLVFVLLAVFLLVIYKLKTRRNSGLNNTGNASSMKTESVTIEDLPSVSTSEDHTYQSLEPGIRSNYSTLHFKEHKM